MGVLSKALSLLSRPDELPYLFLMAIAARKAKAAAHGRGQSLNFCYEMLNDVSRSFAIVIQQLNQELRDAVCIFYLVLRALDTVEDDMALPQKEKLPLLRTFHEIIYDRGWVHTECGTGNYKRLMMEYPLVTDAFLSLKKDYQKVIENITCRMGNGMADYIEREVVTLEDFDEYCYYVAGLVGIGLSELFAASGLEKDDFKRPDTDHLANSMGLFLQKTNIIRDYLEDIQEEPAPRMFWPRDVWSKYATTLDELQYPEKREEAKQCLNELINTALVHVPDCLEYMRRISDSSNFRFCAIPQVMAISTLSLCYDNGKVFEGVVKMRRGQTAKFMVTTRTFEDMLGLFVMLAADLAGKVVATKTDAVSQRTLELVEKIETTCDKMGHKRRTMQPIHPEDELIPLYVRILLLILFGGYACYALGIRSIRDSFGVDPSFSSPGDMAQKCIALFLFLSVLFIVIRGKRI